MNVWARYYELNETAKTVVSEGPLTCFFMGQGKDDLVDMIVLNTETGIEKRAKVSFAFYRTICHGAVRWTELEGFPI